MGNTSSTAARAIRRADRQKVAAEMRLAGHTLVEIGERLGVSHTTVMRDIDTWCEKHPMESCERLREFVLPGMQKAFRCALADVDHEDADVRAKAQRNVGQLGEKLGVVSGFIKQPPPTQVHVTTNAVDISKLPVEDLVTVRRLLYGAPGAAKTVETAEEPKSVENAQPGATSAEQT